MRSLLYYNTKTSVHTGLTGSLDRLYCGLLFKDIYVFVLSFIPSYKGLCSKFIMTLVISGAFIGYLILIFLPARDDYIIIQQCSVFVVQLLQGDM